MDFVNTNYEPQRIWKTIERHQYNLQADWQAKKNCIIAKQNLILSSVKNNLILSSVISDAHFYHEVPCHTKDTDESHHKRGVFHKNIISLKIKQNQQKICIN